MNPSFNLEHYALRSRNYFEQLVDAEGLPYFNVFWLDPTQGAALEAAHDWPDFGDVMSRQWQGAIFLRRMTGETAATESVWQRKILSLIDPADGLLHRPKTTFSENVADWGDASLTLYALVTAAVDSGSPALRQAAARMAEALLKRLQDGQYPGDCFAVKGLMVAARELGCEAALEAARLLLARLVGIGRQPYGRLFTPDNLFAPMGHTHSNLRSMAGALDYALTVGDPVLYSRMEALYRFVKGTGARFGFLPEAIHWRKSDMIGCETCALMDFAGVGVTLANHGHAEYWGDMERLARNQYVESQLTEASWPALEGEPAAADTPQFTWRDLARRMVGAWAGWTSPNHILAYCESLNAHWGGPELKNKTRLLQNCCGGSGVHGLFTLWKNAAHFDAASNTLSVNMHLDKLLPQAEIRCEQPYRGVLRIAMKSDCQVNVRVPEFVKTVHSGYGSSTEASVFINGVELPHTPGLGAALPAGAERPPARLNGNILQIGPCLAGDQIEVRYPLPLSTEEVAVGNPGYRQWRYRVTWKGDTVVRMEALDNELPSTYSDFDQAERPVFYGENGPGRLYQREHFLSDAPPTSAPLHLDDGALNFWNLTS